jgi:hypothetical protein
MEAPSKSNKPAPARWAIVEEGEDFLLLSVIHQMDHRPFLLHPKAESALCAVMMIDGRRTTTFLARSIM